MTKRDSMPFIICLMGPTASGKTPLAIELVQQLACDIISVDSAMVYRGMDIGTAKPTADILKMAPHRLIDIVDPKEAYSAGEFRADALREIADIIQHGKIPLLVGGTMMYFRVLQQGLAKLPKADASTRAHLKERADINGWHTLHAELTHIDPIAAKRIHPQDSQRIQRALEVYQLTGKTITEWQQTETNPLADYRVINFAIAPMTREALHQRIEQRFNAMLAEGLMEEVKRLYERFDLTPDLPSMRSVNYRQIWAYLAGEMTYDTMREQAIAATRQLAKRQLTWLRSWPNLHWLQSDAKDLVKQVRQSSME